VGTEQSSAKVVTGFAAKDCDNSIFLDKLMGNKKSILKKRFNLSFEYK